MFLDERGTSGRSSVTAGGRCCGCGSPAPCRGQFESVTRAASAWVCSGPRQEEAASDGLTAPVASPQVTRRILGRGGIGACWTTVGYRVAVGAMPSRPEARPLSRMEHPEASDPQISAEGHRIWRSSSRRRPVSLPPSSPNSSAASSRRQSRIGSSGSAPLPGARGGRTATWICW
jgi:hypothetical protein